MNKSNNLKNNLKFICIYFIILFVSFICIVKSITAPKEDTKMLYAYNINRIANYKVYLKENNYINEEYMGMNATYITELVESIKSNFIYNYSVSQNATSKAEYKILATLNVEYHETGEATGTKLWTREYTLLEPKTIELDTNQININENIEINFNEYNSEIKTFKKQYGLPIKAYLNIDMIVDSQIKLQNSEKIEKDNSVISLKMPLNEQVFEITENYEKVSKGQAIDKIQRSNLLNIVLLVIGIVLLLVSGIGILNIIRKLISNENKTNYEIALARILKNYGDIVAEVVTPTETEGMKIIDVKNFDQLLDIEEEIRMPILFYETIEKQEGEFTIIYENVVYRYVLGGKD